MKPVSEMSNAELIEESRRRELRRREGKPLAPEPVELQQRENEIDARREKEIQAEIVKLYRAFGCRVYNLSQARATKQTPGLPDMWVVSMDSGLARASKLAWWHEVKTPKGEQSEAQREFQIECKLCYVGYVVGGVQAAEAQLLTFGIAVRGADGKLERPRL
jgi:hypothetical protein